MSVEFDPEIRDHETNDTAPGDGSASDATAGSNDPAGGDAPAGVFERVLVVTDGEATGRAAVDAGLDVAATHGASVDALYVVDTTEAWDVAVERRERAGEAAVDEAEARGERLGVDTRKWFRYGAAHEETLAFAEAHDVDLIVVGSARRTGLDRLVHPETLPVRVQRSASVPVLVVGTDELE